MSQEAILNNTVTLSSFILTMFLGFVWFWKAKRKEASSFVTSSLILLLPIAVLFVTAGLAIFDVRYAAAAFVSSLGITFLAIVIYLLFIFKFWVLKDGCSRSQGGNSERAGRAPDDAH